VPVTPGRHEEDAAGDAVTETGSMVIRPGEGGYNEALAEWENDQHPDREEVVSTASGRKQAMAVVHAIAEDPDQVTRAIESLDDPNAAAEALGHVLVGGTPAVEAFAAEVAEAEGGDVIPAHIVTRIIGEILAEVDSQPSS
jgi:hypothetical protein